MKKMKLLSFVLSGIMAVTALGGVTAGAEEVCTDKPMEVDARRSSVVCALGTYEVFANEEGNEPVIMSYKDYFFGEKSGMTGMQIYKTLVARNSDKDDAKTTARLYHESKQERIALGEKLTVYPDRWVPGEIRTDITSMEQIETITEPMSMYKADHEILLYSSNDPDFMELYEQYMAGETIPERKLRSYEKKFLALNEFKESQTVITFYPNSVDVSGPIPEVVNCENTLTANSGVFGSGVSYHYNEETKGLFFEGTGKLSKSEFDAAFDTFDFSFIFFGRGVKLPGDIEGTTYNQIVGWTMEKNDKPTIPIYTYADSDFTKKFENTMQYMCKDADDIETAVAELKEDYTYYVIDDNADPDTITNMQLVEGLVTKRADGQFTSNGENSSYWDYEGLYVGGGEVCTLIIYGSGTTFTLEEVYEIAREYKVLSVAIATDVILPEELQGFETYDEVDAELLRLIKENAEYTKTELPSVTAVPTLAGDIDLNDEQGIADIVALTKYNSSSELYPITDAVALANADINRDGVINALDTMALIELMLKDYESAV